MDILARNLNHVIDRAFSTFAKDQDWDSRPTSGKWSGKQILGHLIDSAHNNLQRFIRGTYQEDFKIIYDQDEWVKNQHYEKVAIEEVIQLWFLMNKEIVRVWANYPIDRTATKSDVGRDLPEICTIREIAEDYIRHLNHHLEQINRATASTI